MRQSWLPRRLHFKCAIPYVLATFLVSNATAAQYKDAGEYRIHYTTFSSTIIPAEVAASHGIVRADNRIVVNVSAVRGDESQAVEIEGTVTNLLEQATSLEFTEVIESDAVYYLANHLALEHDILQFSLVVTPPGEDPVTIEFLRRYD